MNIEGVYYLEILGYHTCKKSDDVLSKAPFLSGSGERIWLTQGYYFWTDSTHHAHKWGQNSISGDYSIVKCLISFENNSLELLDLVGNVEHQIYFKKLIDKFIEEFGDENLSIRAVIMFLRNKALQNKAHFPFIAIKAKDEYNEERYSFVNVHTAVLRLIERHQLCVFKEGKDKISTPTLEF